MCIAASILWDHLFKAILKITDKPEYLQLLAKFDCLNVEITVLQGFTFELLPPRYWGSKVNYLVDAAAFARISAL